MKRLKKKILGILLSIVMVLGLMPGMSLMTDAANTEVLSEDFGNGIPSTWEVVSGVGQVGVYSFTSESGYAWADPANGQGQLVASLSSPAMDLSQASSATLTFDYKNPSNGHACDDFFVYYAVDDGPEVEIFRDVQYSNTAHNAWQTKTISLPSDALKGNVKIIFKAKCWQGDGVFVDSVSVNADISTPGTNPAAATSFDIPVRVEGTPDGSTGHIELDQQIDVNDPNTFIDIMTGVGGFCIYLVPTDQAAPPDNITGSYEFVYGGTTYRGDFSATKKYDPSYGFYYVVLGGLGANSDSSSSSGHHHHKCEDGHKFSFQVLEAPTTEKDGVGMWCCERCGIPDWNEHENAAPGEKVVISAYTVFNDTLENNIKAAESGATVSITTSRWISVRRGVLEALAEKPGVTLTVNFEYQGMGYVIAIPGGDPALAGILASEDRFFGLMNLGNTYGLTAVEK